MEVDLYSALIVQHYDTLIRSIDPTDYFINKLRIANVITKAEVAQIMTKSSADDRNVSILSFLLDSASNADCMHAFLKILRESRQEHVANLFEKKSEKIPMTDEHFQILSSRLGEVERIMDPDCGIVDELVRFGVLTDLNRQQMNGVASGSAKAAALVRTLLRKSDCCYQKFLGVLKHCCQDHVLYVLNNQRDRQQDMEHEGPNFTPPIRQEFIESMEKNRAEIVENMNPRDSGLLDLMIGCKVLRDYDRVDPRSLDEPRTCCDMNVEIMRLIPRRSQADFDKFIAALIASGQSHIAALFIGEEIHGKIIIKFADQVDKTTQQVVERELKLKLSDLIRNGIQPDNALRRSLKANNVIVSYIRDGCIAIGFRCFTPDSLSKLRELYEAGELDRLLMDVYYPSFAVSGVLTRNLKISDEEFTRCSANFDKNKLMTMAHRSALLAAAKSPRVLDTVVITDELLNKLSFCERRRKAIKRSSGSKRVAAMLESVSMQPDRAFNEVVDVLRSHGHITAAQFISVSAITHSSNTVKFKFKFNAKQKEDSGTASLNSTLGLSEEFSNLRPFDLDEPQNTGTCDDGLLQYCEMLKTQIQQGKKREQMMAEGEATLIAELMETRRQLKILQHRQFRREHVKSYSGILTIPQSAVLSKRSSGISDDHSGISGDKSSGFVDESPHNQQASEIFDKATQMQPFLPGSSIVTETTSSPLLSPRIKSNFKKAFKGKQVQLFDLIDLRDGSLLLQRLKDNDILQMNQIEQVRVFPENHRRVELLLALLKTRPDNLFEPFCQVLRECGHESAVDLIKGHRARKMADQTFSDIYSGLSLATRKTSSIGKTTTPSTMATMGDMSVIAHSSSDLVSGYSSTGASVCPQSPVETNDEINPLLRID